jgi:hypothetical protein
MACYANSINCGRYIHASNEKQEKHHLFISSINKRKMQTFEG